MQIKYPVIKQFNGKKIIRLNIRFVLILCVFCISENSFAIGPGRTDTASKANKNAPGKHCQVGSVSKIHVVSGDKTEKVPVSKLVAIKGNYVFDGGKMHGLNVLPVSAFIKHYTGETKKAIDSIEVASCKGQMSLLTVTQVATNAYLLIQNRRGYLKLVEKIKKDRYRTIMRNVSLISLNQ